MKPHTVTGVLLTLFLLLYLLLENLQINWVWRKLSAISNDYICLFVFPMETKKMATLRSEESLRTQIPKIKFKKIKNVMSIHLNIMYMQLWWICYGSLSRWQSNRWQKRTKEYKIMKKPSHVSPRASEGDQAPAATPRRKRSWPGCCSCCDGQDLWHRNNNNHKQSLPFLVTSCLHFSANVSECLTCVRGTLYGIRAQRQGKPDSVLRGVRSSMLTAGGVAGDVLWNAGLLITRCQALHTHHHMGSH